MVILQRFQFSSWLRLIIVFDNVTYFCCFGMSSLTNTMHSKNRTKKCRRRRRRKKHPTNNCITAWNFDHGFNDFVTYFRVQFLQINTQSLYTVHPLENAFSMTMKYGVMQTKRQILRGLRLESVFFPLLFLYPSNFTVSHVSLVYVYLHHIRLNMHCFCYVWFAPYDVWFALVKFLSVPMIISSSKITYI